MHGVWMQGHSLYHRYFSWYMTTTTTTTTMMMKRANQKNWRKKIINTKRKREWDKDTSLTYSNQKEAKLLWINDRSHSGASFLNVWVPKWNEWPQNCARFVALLLLFLLQKVYWPFMLGHVGHRQRFSDCLVFILRSLSFHFIFCCTFTFRLMQSLIVYASTYEG